MGLTMCKNINDQIQGWPPLAGGWIRYLHAGAPVRSP